MTHDRCGVQVINQYVSIMRENDDGDGEPAEAESNFGAPDQSYMANEGGDAEAESDNEEATS